MEKKQKIACPVALRKEESSWAYPICCPWCGNDFKKDVSPEFYLQEKDPDDYNDADPREEQDDYFYFYTCPACRDRRGIPPETYREFCIYLYGGEDHESGMNEHPACTYGKVND